jgi:hypothetical protein
MLSCTYKRKFLFDGISIEKHLWKKILWLLFSSTSIFQLSLLSASHLDYLTINADHHEKNERDRTRAQPP